MEEKENRCKFWLPKKNRFCANVPLSDSQFCGNHKPRSDGQWIPCPVDPSHSVLKENLEGHVGRCPFVKQAQSLAVQPFYQKGINAGKEEDDNVSSEMKRAAVYSLSVPEFYDLMKRIESVHALICKDIKVSFKMPEACNMWINREVDRKLPFQEKHVMQQASILGNLEELRVLKSSAAKENGVDERLCGDDSCCVPAVVEFGAGRGYLTQMLADCYGIEKVFLVERKSYKLKADRSLRQKESLILERLRIDSIPYLAVGKHLCGPATDLTLRCCLSEQCSQDSLEERRHNAYLRGLAIATCCHHLCQWKHYTNKELFSNLGFTKEEFHSITWFTSWAVDADHSSDLSDVADCRLQLQSSDKEQHHGDAKGVEGVVKNMKAVERAALGFKCKQLIDTGRMVWLKEHGLDAELIKYVPSSISPENHLLVAKDPKCL